MGLYGAYTENALILLEEICMAIKSMELYTKIMIFMSLVTGCGFIEYIMKMHRNILKNVFIISMNCDENCVHCHK